jgi:hypothetical protein
MNYRLADAGEMRKSQSCSMIRYAQGNYTANQFSNRRPGTLPKSAALRVRSVAS